jgi:hypothetical protein
MPQPLERLFLHVGRPKTATTSMQTWFKIHRPKMQRLGVWNPPFPTANRGKHTFLIQEINKPNSSPTLSHIVRQSPTPSAILSHEGLSNQIDLISDAHFEAFRAQTSDVQKTVILVTRDGNAWSSSFYKHCILGNQTPKEPWRGTNMSLEEFRDIDHIKLMMDSDRLIPLLKKQYGATDVIHVRFEDKDWFTNTLEQIGLGALSHLELPRVNDAEGQPSLP